MFNLGVAGACGKMGKRICALAGKDPDMNVSLALESDACPELGADMGEVLGDGAWGVKVVPGIRESGSGLSCLIDFTLPGPTLEHLAECAEKNIPMVIGTTGFDEEGEAAIRRAGDKIPVVFSPNMAVGVNVLFKIVKDAAAALVPEFDVSVDETHHVHKKDAPSGTAKMITRTIREAAGRQVEAEARREGEVIGNHGIIFDSRFETLEIRHNAKSRDVFAAGAIKAARFVALKEPGLYSMFDVLGL
jgi:4-hydroxy-tetrahydrodipicolinate reductase